MSTQANPIVDQAGVNAAVSFDSAAESMLDYNPQASVAEVQPNEANTTAENNAPAVGNAAGDPKVNEGAAAGAAKPGDQHAAAAAADGQKFTVDEAVLQKALADPVHGAIVKQLHDRLQESEKFREFFPTPADAQAALALAPGGLEELKTHVERGKSAAAEQAQFASGNPEQQRLALSSIAEEMPEQFVAGMPVYLELAAKANPEAYSRHMQAELRRSLDAEGVPALLQALWAAGDGDPDNKEHAEAFAKAYSAIREWGDKAGYGKAEAKANAAKPAETPKEKEYRERLEKYEKTEHEQVATSFKTWWEPTTKEISTGVRAELEAQLKDFFPANTEKTFREVMMGRLLDEAEKQIAQQLLADVDHQKKLGNVMNADAWKKDGAATRTQYVNLSVARAKQVLPHVVAKLMTGASKQSVAAAGEKTTREQARAATADVTGHAGGHAARMPLTVKDVKAGGKLAKASDEEILEM